MYIKRIAAVVAALLVIGLVASGMADAAPKDKEVVVVNTDSQPVPTAAQGTTQVAGAVSISGTPNVLVANDANSPVPVEVQETQSVPTVISGQIDLGPNEIHGDELVAVPAGKQLVVEYITVAGFDWGPGVEEDVAHVRLTDLGPHGAPFVSIPVERNSAGRFAGSEPVQWTVDHPFVIRLDLDQHTDEGELEPEFAWSLAWTISGYLVDL